MHASLTITANLIAQSLSGAILAAALLVLKPVHAEIALLSLMLGAAAGWLQSRTLHGSPAPFRAATSSSQIRALLTASAPGRGSIGLMWLNGLSALALMAVGFMPPAAAVAACASFTLARELVCLPAIRALSATP